MLDRILGFEYTLWIVAFAFYAVDVGIVARAGEVLFVESGKRLRPVLARVPFSFRGGDLYWLAPLAPFFGVFRAAPPSPAETATQDAIDIDAVRRQLAPFRWTSSAVFVLLFIAGPALTAWRGLLFAAVAVVPFAYLTSLIGVGLLMRRARALGLDRRAVWSLGFDCFACAPYAANMTKRLALRTRGAGQTETWLTLGATQEERAHVQAVLAERKAQA